MHLATHGYFEPEDTKAPTPAADPFLLERQQRTFVRNPLLLSGLALSGANANREQGLLTAEEVKDLDLRGTELVVLSACQTGLGKVAGGEGVLGLQRAFHQAGARSCLVSLWSVSDAATAVLMEHFYANLWNKKMPPAQALRQAQLTVLRNPKLVLAKEEALRSEWARRGIKGTKALPLPEGGKIDMAALPERSPPAWWAAFLLSGDPAE